MTTRLIQEVVHVSLALADVEGTCEGE